MYFFLPNSALMSVVSIALQAKEGNRMSYQA